MWRQGDRNLYGYGTFEGRLDENVMELAQDADIMVYDAAYTDEEYPKFEVGALDLARSYQNR